MGKVEQAVGGVGMEEKKFIWRIENFAVIKKHDELIQAQKFEFQAGGSIGLSSKWTVYLVCNKKKPNYIGIYLHLSEKPKTKQDYLIAECEFKVKDFMGCCVEKEKIRTRDWYAQNLGSGLPVFIMKGGMFATPLVKGGLVIHCKFRMYANSPRLEKLPVSCSGSGTQVGSSEVEQSNASKENEFCFGGLGVEEKKLIWQIDNFAVVKSHDEIIKTQKFEFQAGDSIGLSSKWMVHFRLDEEKYPGSIGLYLQLIEKPKTKQDYLIAECGFEIKADIIGTPYADKKFGTKDWYKIRGCGFSSFIKKTEELPLMKGSLVIHCNFRMYANSPSLEKMPVDVDDTLDNSQLSSKATVGKDWAHLNLYPNLNLLPLGVEEKKLIWRIDNFAVLKWHDELIKAEYFEFQAGDSIGLSSKWEVYLQCNKEEDPDYIGIILQLTEKPKTEQDYLIAECEFEIKNVNVIGSPFAVKKTGRKDWYDGATLTSPCPWAWGFPRFISKTEEVPLVEDSLVIHCNFRMYANSTSLEKMPVDDPLDKFLLSSKASVGKDLAHLNLYPNLNLLPVSCSGIEIDSNNEGKQIKASKEKGLVEFVRKEGIVSKKKSCCIV